MLLNTTGVMHCRRASFVECVSLHRFIINYINEEEKRQKFHPVRETTCRRCQARLLSSCFATIVAQCRLSPQRRTLSVISTLILLDIALDHMEISA